MKVNLEMQTNSKFRAVCNICQSDNVKFGMSYGTTNDGGGGTMNYTKLIFNCGDCKNKWSEKY